MSIGGNIAGTVSGLPGPNSGGLKKSANWSSQNVDPAEDGTLDPAQDITYTIASDLRSWDGSNVKKTLTDNVIISDALPTQATWNTGDPSFVTATGIELEQIAPVALAAFAGDDYVGTYFVEGQKMHINIGKGTGPKQVPAGKPRRMETEHGIRAGQEWVQQRCEPAGPGIQ